MSQKTPTGGDPNHLHAMRLRQATGKLADVTPKQQQAIGLMLGGCSLVDVARRAGVSRTTVYHWMRSEKFIAALESWRSDMQHAARARLLGLSGMAFKAIHRALEAGDAKTALAMFKGLGVFDPARDDEEEEKIILRRIVDRTPRK